MTTEKFNKDDPQLLQLARALADIGSNDFPETVVDFGKNMLQDEPKSIPETIEHFVAHGFHALAVAGAINGLRNFGVVEELEGDRFQFSKEMKNLIAELNPKAIKENDMNKNQKLDTNDETIKQLANKIATGADADSDFESYICRTIFLAGPKTPDDLKFIFEDKSKYKEDMDKLSERFDDMVNSGILQRVDDDGRVTISPEMLKMVITANPGAMTQDQARETKGNQNQQPEGNEGKKDQKAGHARGLQVEIDKISTEENLDLAKRLANHDSEKVDDDVRLVRAMYDNAAEGVNFDTINSRFDASGNRGQIFMSLSKELQKRGVVQKLEQEGGNLYVVTMAFRALMEDAVHKARDEGRFEGEGADVAKAPHITLHDHTQQGDKSASLSNLNLYEMADDRPRRVMHAQLDDGEANLTLPQFNDSSARGSRSQMHRQDNRMSSQQQGSMQRSVDHPQGKGTGRVETRGSDDRLQNTGEEDKIQPGYYRERKEIQPDASVMSVNILAFGVPIKLEDVLKLYQASQDLMDASIRNPDADITFTAYGIVMNEERAQTFIEHAHHYGFVR